MFRSTRASRCAQRTCISTFGTAQADAFFAKILLFAAVAVVRPRRRHDLCEGLIVHGAGRSFCAGGAAARLFGAVRARGRRGRAELRRGGLRPHRAAGLCAARVRRARRRRRARGGGGLSCAERRLSRPHCADAGATRQRSLGPHRCDAETAAVDAGRGALEPPSFGECFARPSLRHRDSQDSQFFTHSLPTRIHNGARVHGSLHDCHVWHLRATARAPSGTSKAVRVDNRLRRTVALGC